MPTLAAACSIHHTHAADKLRWSAAILWRCCFYHRLRLLAPPCCSAHITPPSLKSFKAGAICCAVAVLCSTALRDAVACTAALRETHLVVQVDTDHLQPPAGQHSSQAHGAVLTRTLQHRPWHVLLVHSMVRGRIQQSGRHYMSARHYISAMRWLPRHAGLVSDLNFDAPSGDHASTAHVMLELALQLCMQY
jgi:hypothetical protein